MPEERPSELNIKIPDKYKIGLKKLITIEDGTFSKLISTINSSPPTLHAEDIVSFFVKKHNIHIEGLSILVEALISLYHFRNEEAASDEEVAQELIKNIQLDELGTQGEITIKYSDELISTLKKRILDFLKTKKNLEVVSKASSLLAEHKNIHLDSQIITDIRPIFTPEIDQGPGGMLIVHTLRVKYRTINGIEEIFINLDSDDMCNLIASSEEALEKENSLRIILEKAEIPILDSQPSLE